MTSTTEPPAFVVEVEDHYVRTCVDPANLTEQLVALLARDDDVLSTLHLAIAAQRDLWRSDEVSSAFWRSDADRLLTHRLEALAASRPLREALTATYSHVEAEELSTALADAVATLEGQARHREQTPDDREPRHLEER